MLRIYFKTPQGGIRGRQREPSDKDIGRISGEGEWEGRRMGREESYLTAWFQKWFGQADEDSSHQRYLLKDSCMPPTGSAFETLLFSGIG